MPRIAPVVEMPVPPTPVISTSTVGGGVGRGWFGEERDLPVKLAAGLPRGGPQHAAGHRHEARAVPLDAGQVQVAGGLIDAALATEPGLRGSTAMQLDAWLQSPQPSQTRSFITIRRSGVGRRPRLRSRLALRGAELVEDDGADAGYAAHLLLDLAQPVPVRPPSTSLGQRPPRVTVGSRR